MRSCCAFNEKLIIVIYYLSFPCPSLTPITLCLAVILSLCLFVSLPLCPSVSLSVCLPLSLSLSLSLYIYIYIHIYIYIYTYIHCHANYTRQLYLFHQAWHPPWWWHFIWESTCRDVTESKEVCQFIADVGPLLTAGSTPTIQCDLAWLCNIAIFDKPMQ